MENTFQLILIPEYFKSNDTGFRMPPIMKRVRSESDIAYETRLKNYLLNVDNKLFQNISYLIDPQDPI